MKTEFTDHFCYQMMSNAEEIAKKMISANTEIRFKNPVAMHAGYPCFAISNHNGTIIVDTILNGEWNRAKEENREPRHENTTKGTESLNFVTAVYLLAAEQLEYAEIPHPEWVDERLELRLG